jgi:hypothetical protein
VTEPADNRAASFVNLLRFLESSSFHDLAGTHLDATIPVSRQLLNHLAADALKQRSLPVRDVDIQPHAGDQFDIVVNLTWPFVPPVRSRFVVELQPRLPESPTLVLRWSLLGLVGAIASRFASSITRLPHGFRVEADRLMIDVAALAASRKLDHLLPFVTSLAVRTTEGRIVFDVALDVR